MKKYILGFLLFFSAFVFAQNTISGTFAPAKDYSWLIAYRLKPGTQVYVADTAIKGGKFTLNIPENSPKGMYRLVYAVPQEEFYFDVVYNGEEDIKLHFTTENGVSFLESKENIIFNSYFNETRTIENEIITYYSSGSTNKKQYLNLIKKLKNIQSNYETKSAGLMANTFIKANKLQLPETYVDVFTFVSEKKKNYFNDLDFTNTTLQASGFLTDKILNYVFTALPLEQMTKEATEGVIQDNVDQVNLETKGVDSNYRLHLFYTIWSQAAASKFNATSDYVFSTYLNKLAQDLGKKDIVEEIELHNRLRIGAIAPEISWKEENNVKTLNTLEGSKNYVLVFWSSTCSHCLKELPALHKELKNNPDITVVAIGMEEDTSSWDIEKAKLPNFKHAIALGKWESNYAKLYAVNQTPTYFILDSNKRFIAKPEDDKQVVEYLKK
ncbi:thiol-disulfide isomerase/thioredoxin [Maribacter vaceletii]|uniref:Thiol-disulfide isomerase/thioredoxin n=1 Tax=Maribacter vaceletii TaxID=1206816 RepID=A0A495ECD4_9FLAO|nr:thioredoxin-like domain-containing protein [Maribacter vaceletii]RKR14530.1 thiol-disulfide isomerase/thioredoxin [Maribacter vaceletii]